MNDHFTVDKFRLFVLIQPFVKCLPLPVFIVQDGLGLLPDERGLGRI